jgi:hypothetical protein
MNTSLNLLLGLSLCRREATKSFFPNRLADCAYRARVDRGTQCSDALIISFAKKIVWPLLVFLFAGNCFAAVVEGRFDWGNLQVLFEPADGGAPVLLHGGPVLGAGSVVVQAGLRGEPVRDARSVSSTEDNFSNTAHLHDIVATIAFDGTSLSTRAEGTQTHILDGAVTDVEVSQEFVFPSSGQFEFSLPYSFTAHGDAVAKSVLFLGPEHFDIFYGPGAANSMSSGVLMRKVFNVGPGTRVLRAFAETLLFVPQPPAVLWLAGGLLLLFVGTQWSKRRS